MNSIARAYLGIKDPVKQMLAVRQGLAVRQDEEARQVKADLHQRRARAPRKKSST